MTYSISNEKLYSYMLINDYLLDVYREHIDIDFSVVNFSISKSKLNLLQVLYLGKILPDLELDRGIRKGWLDRYCKEWRPELWNLIEKHI